MENRWRKSEKIERANNEMLKFTRVQADAFSAAISGIDILEKFLFLAVSLDLEISGEFPERRAHCRGSAARGK